MGPVHGALVLMLAVAGCYAPRPPSGAACAPSGACPDGLVCSPATLTCELRAIDGGGPDALKVDAAIDARPDASIDAPTDAAIDAAPALPLLVQQAVSFATATNQVSVTLPATPGAGHVLVMIGGGPQAPLDSVSGGGVTWTVAARSTTEANIEIWFGVTNGSSSTVTISLVGNTGQLTIAVSEWANLASTNLLDASRIGTNVSSPASVSAVTTTSAPELVLFGVGAFGASTWGMPSDGPWTAMTKVASSVGQAEWYRVVTAPTTLAPSVTENGGSWDAALVSLRGLP